MFNDKIDPIIYSAVANIGGKILLQKWLSQLASPGLMMRGNWPQKLDNVLYFTESLVNIISESALAESKKDDGGTWVLDWLQMTLYT